MKYLYLLVLALFAGYIFILVFVYFNQRNLLYHPTENNYLDDQIQFNYEEVFKIIDKDRPKNKTWDVLMLGRYNFTNSF